MAVIPTNLPNNIVHCVPGLENIMMFSKTSKYRKCQKYHDIIDIFQKMKISNKL